MTDAKTLLAALHRCLDEDEATAKAAAGDRLDDTWLYNPNEEGIYQVRGSLADPTRCQESDPSYPDMCNDTLLLECESDMSHRPDEVAAHVLRWQPKTALKTVTAHRKLLAEHLPDHADGRCTTCANWRDTDATPFPQASPWPCPTVSALIELYADRLEHPG